nr:glycosyl hydrolase [Victivallales bacterium]
TRDVPWASRISHWNSWWPYYGGLAAYVSRACFMLRQGRFVADILIYSPHATMWSERAVWGRERRIMPYGNLARTLVANGYDFDIANDDILTRKASAKNGKIEIAGHQYAVLILPNVSVIPIQTMRAIHALAEAGVLVLALQTVPTHSAGMKHHIENDFELERLVKEVFYVGRNGVHIPEYVINSIPIRPHREPYKKSPPLNHAQQMMLKEIGRVVKPDFSLAGNTQSDGLTFIHRIVDDVDIYFITNLEPSPITTEVTFRVTGKVPQRWNAVTGSVGEMVVFRQDKSGTTMPIDFEAWESAFFVFTPGNIADIPSATFQPPRTEPLRISGNWLMTLEGYGFRRLEMKIETLSSWTENPETRYFSGTGRYETTFEAPKFSGRKIELDLGSVGTVAEVEINGQKAGVAWMHPYRFDISSLVKRGENLLTILVTNTIANYVAGLSEAPDVPAELQPRLGKANPSIYVRSNVAEKDMNETDLPPSGLMGPVTLRICK